MCRAVDTSELEIDIRLELKNIKPIISESIHTTFITEGLTDYIKHIQICEIESVQEDVCVQQVLNEVWLVYNCQFLTLKNINYFTDRR